MRTGWSYVWRRLVLFLALALLGVMFLALGLMVGYGVIGDGENIWSILSPDKWQELIGKFTGK